MHVTSRQPRDTEKGEVAPWTFEEAAICRCRSLFIVIRGHGRELDGICMRNCRWCEHSWAYRRKDGQSRHTMATLHNSSLNSGQGSVIPVAMLTLDHLYRIVPVEIYGTSRGKASLVINWCCQGGCCVEHGSGLTYWEWSLTLDNVSVFQDLVVYIVAEVCGLKQISFVLKLNYLIMFYFFSVFITPILFKYTGWWKYGVQL